MATNTQQIQSLSEEKQVLDFIYSSQIFGEQESRTSFHLHGHQILKKVILETPSLPEETECTEKTFLKDKSLLLNEFNITQEILKFQCVNTIAKIQDKKQEQQMEEEYLTTEEYFGCHPNCTCIQGRYHLLLPTGYLDFGDRIIMASPHANKNDAWKYLIDANLLNNGLGNSKDASILLLSSMKLAYQIGAAINHLHNNLNIAHCDIKPDNFFCQKETHPLLPGSRQMFFRTQFNQDGTFIPKYSVIEDDKVTYYLGDFGFAKKVGFSTSKEARQLFEQKNRHFLAPEILALIDKISNNSKNIEKTGDVFAFGASLFHVLFLTRPSFNNNIQPNHKMFWRNVKIQLDIYSQFTDINLLKNLLEGMLEKDPLKRFTIQQVLEHPWLSDIKNYLQIEQTQ